jgi:hypothetical protein
MSQGRVLEMCNSRHLLRFAFPAAILFSQSALASFHLMQINQVIGSYFGDATVQAIELRMRATGEESVSQGRIRAFDADGQNPILIIDFTTNVAIGNAASRVLILSPNFPLHTHPPAVGDFTMTNLIPASYLSAGSLTYETDAGIVLWRLSWGGSAYTGPNTGATTNDADGNFGPPFPDPLSCNGVGALLFRCISPPTCHTNSSTTNAADYQVNTSTIIFRNNAGTDFELPRPFIAGDSNCDNAVDFDDVEPFVMALLDASEYLATHPCCDILSSDIDLNGSRDGRDVIAFVELLLTPQ